MNKQKSIAYSIIPVGYPKNPTLPDFYKWRDWLLRKGRSTNSGIIRFGNFVVVKTNLL